MRCTVCTVGRPYCQYNRARGRADRLLVTIAISAVDIQHYTSTQLHRLSVSAVQLLWAVQRKDTGCLCALCVQQCTSPILIRSTLTSPCCTEANNNLFTKYSQQWCCYRDGTECGICERGRDSSVQLQVLLTPISPPLLILRCENLIKPDIMTMMVFILWLRYYAVCTGETEICVEI